MSALVSRRAILLIATILALAVSAVITPSNAEASVSRNYKGWTYVNANGCAPGGVCTMIYRYETPVWTWTGYRWDQSFIGDGTNVYAWPYASGWHWIWTEYNGWQAIQSYKLYSPSYYAV